MNERKILLFILFVFVYCLYSVNMWFTRKVEIDDKNTDIGRPVAEINKSKIKNITDETQQVWEPKVMQIHYENSCSILEIFTEKPSVSEYEDSREEDAIDMTTNPVTVIGITVILIVLTLNALLDVLKVKEEEKARRKLNPEGERRQSLAEFANKKPMRRESSKFGLQLFQIAESVANPEEDTKSRRKNRPYTRGESTNSYLSDRNTQMETSASTSETPTGEPRLIKRQSVAKIFGVKPAPIVRRSSFPALPLNPEVQALMLGHRQASVDSDDEGDGRGRRIRIIRRY